MARDFDAPIRRSIAESSNLLEVLEIPWLTGLNECTAEVIKSPVVFLKQTAVEVALLMDTGKSAGFLSKMLDGESTPILATAAKSLSALDLKLCAPNDLELLIQ